MLRLFLPLTIAATLLAPLAVLAEDAPATPATPAAPTAPAAPAPHKNNNRVGGKITAVDATKKTVTVTHRKTDTTLTVADDAKIYKPGDAKGSPTGTWADLTFGTMINAHITGDAAAPTATEIHIRAPKTTPATMPAATPTTAPAATPATP